MLTITLESLFVLVFAHWFFDFFCQTKWMAENKSDSWKALFSHTVIYSGGMIVTMYLYSLITNGLSIDNSIFFGLITFVIHTLTDAVSSRYSRKAYKVKKYRVFFNIIGFDQLTHIVQLTLSYVLLS